MPHDLAFADSARPTRVACLRLLLQPYSIGHELLLWQSRNALLSPRDKFNALTPDEQTNALVLAVSICSRNWQENHKPEKWLHLWWWLIRNTDWPVAIADFRNYLEAGRATLPVVSKETYEITAGISKSEDCRALGSPFPAQLILFAVDKLHTPLDEVYDLSYALTAALYFTQMEYEGGIKVENLKEMETKAEMIAHREFFEAEEKAKAEQAKEETCPKP